jgi:hypothetical protein
MEVGIAGVVATLEYNVVSGTTSMVRQCDAGRRGLVVLRLLGGVDDGGWPDNGIARGSAVAAARVSTWRRSTLGVVGAATPQLDLPYGAPPQEVVDGTSPCALAEEGASTPWIRFRRGHR